MRKGLTIIGAFCIILLVLGQFALPMLTERSLETKAVEALKTKDVQVRTSTMPGFLLLLGQVDDLQAVAHQGKIGQLYLQELTLSGKGVHLDMAALLQEGEVRVTSAKELALKGIVSEENLREVLSRRIERLENVQVQIKPERVLVTAEAKIFGHKAEIELAGKVIEDLGSLYFRMEHLHLKNSRIGTARLEGIFGDMFGDIRLAGPDELPFGLVLQRAEQGEGSIVMQAGYQPAEK